MMLLLVLLLSTAAEARPVTKAEKGQILSIVQNFLADPYSLRSTGISDVQPLQGDSGRVIQQGICVQFNGKNAYGSYVGIDRMVFVVTPGGIVRGDWRQGVSTATCLTEGVSYRPFPELAAIQ